MSNQRPKITISTRVAVNAEKAWEVWTSPEHITHWNFASDDWKCPRAENDLKPGGKFNYRMEAVDGSMGFDFGGQFIEVEPHKHLSFRLDDGREVVVIFTDDGHNTTVTETFEAEDQNPIKMQEQGWQAILNNYKKQAETL